MSRVAVVVRGREGGVGGKLSRVKIDQAVERATAGGKICTSAVMGCIKKKKILEDFIKMMRSMRARMGWGSWTSILAGRPGQMPPSQQQFYALTLAIKGESCILTSRRFASSRAARTSIDDGGAGWAVAEYASIWSGRDLI